MANVCWDFDAVSVYQEFYSHSIRFYTNFIKFNEILKNHELFGSNPIVRGEGVKPFLEYADNEILINSRPIHDQPRGKRGVLCWGERRGFQTLLLHTLVMLISSYYRVCSIVTN